MHVLLLPLCAGVLICPAQFQQQKELIGPASASNAASKSSTAVNGDYGDLAGLVTEDDASKGLDKRVQCQGCWDAFVDH
jgi:hypothetical protein